MYSYSIKVYIGFFLSDFVYNPRFDILRTYLRRRVTALLAKNFANLNLSQHIYSTICLKNIII